MLGFLRRLKTRGSLRTTCRFWNSRLPTFRQRADTSASIILSWTETVPNGIHMKLRLFKSPSRKTGTKTSSKSA